jgi:hypothetical protein
LKQPAQPEDQFSLRNPLAGLCINISVPQNTSEAIDRATPEMKAVVGLLQKHLEDTKKLNAQTSGGEASPVLVQCALKEVISSEGFLNSIAANVTALLKPSIAETLDTLQPLIAAVFSHDSMLRKIDRSVEDILIRLDSNAQGMQTGEITSWVEELAERNVPPTKGVDKPAENQPEASGTQADAKQLNLGPDENGPIEIADGIIDVREILSQKEYREGEKVTSLELRSQLRGESTERAEGDYSLRETPNRSSSPTSNDSRDNSMNMSLHSSTNSAYSEDSTDWEGDSDEECLVESPLTRERLESRLRHYQRTMADKRLTPENAELVDNLIFDQAWQEGSRKCESGTVSTFRSRSGSGSSSKAPQLDTPSVATTKRSRDNGEDETQEGSGRGFKRSQQPSEDPDDLEDGRPFACPFRKHNPGKYLVKEWRTCALTPYKTVARLK